MKPQTSVSIIIEIQIQDSADVGIIRILINNLGITNCNVSDTADKRKEE